MKTFDLPDESRLRLLKATPRKEHHGPDLVQAISLRLRWETTNERLYLLHPQLKDMLYWRSPAVEAQSVAEGIPPVTVELRVPGVALPLKLDLAFTGYTMTIDHGIDEESCLELYVCPLDKFTVDAKEGGTVAVEWSLSSNKEVTPELVGILCGLEGSEIIGTLTPPASSAGVIDGSVEAFERDHPDADPNQDGMFDDDAPPGSEGMDPNPPRDATDAMLDDVAKNGAGHTGSPIVYQDADKPSRTWTGKGKTPPWLKQALATGKTLADFAVEGH